MGRHVGYFGLMLEMFAGWMLEMGMVEAVVYSDDKEEEAAVEACVEPCCNMFLERQYTRCQSKRVVCLIICRSF